MQLKEGVKERLVEYLKYIGVGQKSFEVECGLANGFVNNIGKSIRKESLDKISAKHPKLNKVWLIMGEGTMLIEDRINLSGTVSLNDIVEEKKEEYTSYKEEVFRLRKECNEKANRIIELMEEVERLRKENANLKIK